MTAEQMVRSRRPEWSELETWVRVFSKTRRRALRPEHVSRLAALFRNVCSDLAWARAQGYPTELVDYLNMLAARTHNVFYVAPPAPLHRLTQFFTHTFPLAVRQNGAYVTVVLFLFFGSMAATFVLSRVNETVLFEMFPESTLQQFAKMYEKGHAHGRSESVDALMAGFYVRNNVGIAFRCFATGIFFGLGSVVVILFNGALFGAVLGFLTTTPSSLNLLSFVIGHGPFELVALCLAGAAGLRLGFGPIITRNRPRLQSLRLAATDAVRLILGATALLLVAALIEGFFSPSSLPLAVKFGFGGTCLAFLIWYLGLRGHKLHRAMQSKA